MYDSQVKYADIFAGDIDSLEIEFMEKKKNNIDYHISKDLTYNLQKRDIQEQKDNFDEVQDNKINTIDTKINYSYDQYGRNIDEYKEKRSSNNRENTLWKKEISLVQEQDKIKILTSIRDNGFLVDKIVFLDESNCIIRCLSTIIESIDEEEDDDTIIFISPEFIFNDRGDIQEEEKDMSLEVCIDQIKELIVNQTRYIFLL